MIFPRKVYLMRKESEVQQNAANRHLSFRSSYQKNGDSGKKRIFYALGNLLLMALGVLAAVWVKRSRTVMNDGSFVGGLLL